MLEFACKCIRRAMELADFKLDEILDLLATKVKIAPNIEEGINQMLKTRISLLEQDIVMKQRKRFE